MTWRPDLFSDSMAASGIQTGTKLYISNLDYGVSNEDIKVCSNNSAAWFSLFFPPVTGRSRVRVAVSSHCTGEGKACH